MMSLRWWIMNNWGGASCNRIDFFALLWYTNAKKGGEGYELERRFQKSFDRIYEIVRRKYPDIRFPCYGGRFYWFLITRHFESLYFYLTENSLIYTASSAYINEIPFDRIKNLSIKRGLFVKSSIHIRIVADKKYHLLLKDMKWLSTRMTGNNEDNIRGFIATLQASVKDNS